MSITWTSVRPKATVVIKFHHLSDLIIILKLCSNQLLSYYTTSISVRPKSFSSYYISNVSISTCYLEALYPYARPNCSSPYLGQFLCLSNLNQRWYACLTSVNRTFMISYLLKLNVVIKCAWLEAAKLFFIWSRLRHTQLHISKNERLLALYYSKFHFSLLSVRVVRVDKIFKLTKFF